MEEKHTGFPQDNFNELRRWRLSPEAREMRSIVCEVWPTMWTGKVSALQMTPVKWKIYQEFCRSRATVREYVE